MLFLGLMLITFEYREPVETVLEFKIPTKFENEQFGKMEYIFGLKIIIEVVLSFQFLD